MTSEETVCIRAHIPARTWLKAQPRSDTRNGIADMIDEIIVFWKQNHKD